MATDGLEWQELKRETAFKKYSHHIERVDFRLPNGLEADFYLRHEGRVGAVLALTADDQVVLARQFRPGPMAVLDELPGGGIDAGEDPQAGVSRELLEETGYAGDFELVGTCIDSAYSSLLRYCFVARNCHKVAEPIHTDYEQTEPILMSLPNFRRHLRTGRLSDIDVAYLCLDYASLL